MLKKNNDTSLEVPLLSVQEAAEYLGVHAATVRRWAYAKRLQGSKIGIRGDWRFAKESLVKMSIPNVSDSGFFSASHSDTGSMGNMSHFVQFYEDDAFLLQSIKKYIATGDVAIVIATKDHRERLEKSIELQEDGRKKKYIFLDAAETLSQFMVQGDPDPELFDATIGGLIRDIVKDFKELRAYGEMVAILWAEGNKNGAIALEELWNNLQKKYSFTLYCAYPMRDLGESGSSDAFSDVCMTHSNVLPTENYSGLDTHDKQLREIAILQQKAQALETEIANHKKTELKLLEAVESLKGLDQRKEDFLSATSHELKTPLTSQKAFIQLLQKQIEKNKEEKYLRYITKINEQSDKLTKLVNALLDASKVQGGKLQLTTAFFDLNTCVQEAVEEIQTISMKHTIIMKGEITKNVFGDKEKISQVIINLLTNAIKYSPHADKVTVSLKDDDTSAIISVRDFGIGIDKKHQTQIFDRFYRVNDSDEKTYPGLGMGLYIASEIVKRHKGRMEVMSIKGNGTTFRFILPLS